MNAATALKSLNSWISCWESMIKCVSYIFSLSGFPLGNSYWTPTLWDKEWAVMWPHQFNRVVFLAFSLKKTKPNSYYDHKFPHDHVCHINGWLVCIHWTPVTATWNRKWLSWTILLGHLICSHQIIQIRISWMW